MGVSPRVPQETPIESTYRFLQELVAPALQRIEAETIEVKADVRKIQENMAEVNRHLTILNGRVGVLEEVRTAHGIALQETAKRVTDLEKEHAVQTKVLEVVNQYQNRDIEKTQAEFKEIAAKVFEVSKVVLPLAAIVGLIVDKVL